MTKTYDHLLYLSQAGANVLHLASYEWERVRGLVHWASPVSTHCLCASGANP
jgi:hypothetical protein